MENNLEWYNGWRSVPANAQRKIQGGNLSGKTDINPMWRIKALTEKFGPAGFGWYTEIVEHWEDRAVIDYKDGQPLCEICSWVRVRLYVKDPATGEWSRPIEGVGGNKTYGKGKGSGINDESYKMSETDAIGVCVKKLGIGADVYWEADATKYTGGAETADRKPTLVQAIDALEAAADRSTLVAAYHKYKPYFDGNAEFDMAVRRMGAKFPKAS